MKLIAFITAILLLLCCGFTLHSPKHSMPARTPAPANTQADALRASLLAPNAKDPSKKIRLTAQLVPAPTPVAFAPITVTGSVDSGSTIVAPSPRPAKVSWAFPVAAETPEMVFRLRHSLSLSTPLNLWAVLTNVPRTARSVIVMELYPAEFFTLTASNRNGESQYATK